MYAYELLLKEANMPRDDTIARGIATTISIACVVIRWLYMESLQDSNIGLVIPGLVSLHRNPGSSNADSEKQSRRQHCV